MSDLIKGEKFKTRAEALEWCADNKPVFNSALKVVRDIRFMTLQSINEYWQGWYKAIPKPVPTVIEGYVYRRIFNGIWEFKEIDIGSAIIPATAKRATITIEAGE